MSEYRVTSPCVYAQDGRAVMHLHAGAFVEIDDDVAATIADCVQLIDRSGAEAEAESADVTQLPQQPVTEPEVLDPDGAEAVSAEDSVAAEDTQLADARRERRNRNRGSDA